MMSKPQIIDAGTGLKLLFASLRGHGFTLVGPTIRDQAIVYGELDGVDDLPAGWTDEQEGGHYRLRRRDDNAYFGYAVGPHSYKQFLHVPYQQLWRADRKEGALRITPAETSPPKYAFIGVRSCEIHAMEIQDRVLMGGAFTDPHYAARREDVFIVAVNCGQAGGTCFCASMNTGPGADHGFDLALTELIDADRHSFLVEAGSERGSEMLSELPGHEAADEELRRAQEVVAGTAAQMGREMDAGNVRDLLLRNLEHPRWDEVAERCLSCGNCTSVCPTCFCTTTVDTSDLSGDSAERSRCWDSCFNLEFSYLHGGSVRQSIKSRYRQWMTHKLATWHDQFGTSGCVGCGRCITWCPVGIDITEEVRAIQRSEDKHREGGS
jgi:sulfhydrogenase subunit beta (sulfur reductase)